MKILNANSPSEAVFINVEQSPVWELILGIAGYTHEHLRHTFELDEEWQTGEDAMPPSLAARLNEIQLTNLWYGMILLQNQFAADSVQDFIGQLHAASTADFYEWLLPYQDRELEPLRKATAAKPNHSSLWKNYANLFKDHDYLEGYVEQLYQLSQSEMIELMAAVLKEWEQMMSKKPEWDRWLRALAFEQKQAGQLDIHHPSAEIERVTGGVDYMPEPSVWTIKLIPQVSYRPWVLTIRTADTKLFFYPVKEEHLLEPGIPSKELISGHKALGDELRLKLLYQLQESPLSLQEMSARFNISKTTLHHQLTLLKAAKFISVDKGVYSINAKKLEDFTVKLMSYFGTNK